jgi:hypothetical protein
MFAFMQGLSLVSVVESTLVYTYFIPWSVSRTLSFPVWPYEGVLRRAVAVTQPTSVLLISILGSGLQAQPHLSDLASKLACPYWRQPLGMDLRLAFVKIARVRCPIMTVQLIIIDSLPGLDERKAQVAAGWSTMVESSSTRRIATGIFPASRQSPFSLHYGSSTCIGREGTSNP